MSTSKVTTPSSSKPANNKEGSSSNSTSSRPSSGRQSRFRGDVPAFNPTGQSPFVLAQQFQTPPQAFPQHHQPYQQHPQMMYGNQVPGTYMPYMAYPDYMMGYQYFPMPTTPFPQPYMAPHMNSMTNYMAPNSKPKKYSKGQNAYNNTNSHNNHQGPSMDPSMEGLPQGMPPTTPSYAPYSTRSETPSTESYTPQHTEGSHEATLPEQTPPSPHVTTEIEDKVSEQRLPSVAETSQGSPSELKIAKEASAQLPQEDDCKDARCLPLTFNTTLDEYSSLRRSDASLKQTLLQSKLARVQKYVQQRKNTSGSSNLLINKNGLRQLIDHGSGKFAQELIYPAELLDVTERLNDKEVNEKTQKTIPTNWASVLQSTAAKKVSKKTSTPSKPAYTPIEISRDASATPPQDSRPQSLGVLLFRILFDPSFSLSSFPSYKINPRGLTNTGNICYMNAVLQCLMFCEPFNKLIRYVDEKAVGSLDKNSLQPIIDATIQFIKDFLKVTSQNGSNNSNGTLNSHGIVIGRPLSPEVLYQKLVENTKFKHLKWGQQEDAEEFLTYFLDGLHEDFVKAAAGISPAQIDELIESCQANTNDSTVKQIIKSKIKSAYRVTRTSHNAGEEEIDALEGEEETSGWSEVGTGKRVSTKRVVDVEPSPITLIFGGRFRSVLTIPKGKESQSITVDPFRCMLVDITQKDVTTIEDALWSLHQIEKIPFKIDSEREVIAKKRTFIDQLPEVLLLQLKRFAYQQEDASSNEKQDESDESNGNERVAYGTIEKVMKEVKFGLNLTIPPECLSATLRAANEKTDYKLVGVIYHHGRNAEGGHYTCDVYRNGIAESANVGDKKWLRIDDTAVEAITSDAVIETPEAKDKSAYILMYQRK